MTKGKPLTLLLKFVLPIFLGFIFQQFYNMVDTVIVGRYVSPTALAAVGSTGTIMFMIMGLANGMTTGYTVLISQNKEYMPKIITPAMRFSVIGRVLN